MLFAGGQGSRSNYGVAIIVDDGIAGAILEFVPLNDRVEDAVSF